jgi:hypothetical protein
LQILLVALAIATVLFNAPFADLLCLGLGLLATGLLLYALAKGH